MNYSEALSFVFKDKDWVKKMAIGGTIAFISFMMGLFFIIGFFIVGYYIGVIRNVAMGEPDVLPEWSNLSKLFVDGILGCIISLVYLLAIGGLCTIGIISVASDSLMTDVEQACAIIAISFMTLVSLIIFINFGLMQFATTDNFGAAFSISQMADLIRSGLANFLAISVFSVILNLILLCAGLGIFSPFTNFWGMVVQAHLFGQCAKNLQGAPSALQSA